MSEKDDNKQKLIEFVEQLNSLSFPSSPISMELVEYVSESFRKYLDQEKRTLDQAFGMTGKVGPPFKINAEHRRLAEVIFEARSKGSSWIEVTEYVTNSLKSNVTDERELRRIFKKYWPQIVYECLVEELPIELKMDMSDERGN